MSCVFGIKHTQLVWFPDNTHRVVFSDLILNYIGSSILKLVSTVSKDILTVSWSASAEYPEFQRGCIQREQHKSARQGKLGRRAGSGLVYLSRVKDTHTARAGARNV